MRPIHYIGLAILLPFMGLSQTMNYPNKFFQPLSVNGEIRLGGGYRYEVGTTNEIYNYRKTPVLNGGVMINSSNYIWNPNFLILDLGAEYNPELRHEEYLVVPNRSESRTLKKLEAATTFFSQKPLTIRTFINYSENLTNRENLTNLKTKSLNFGGNLNWSNKIVPVQISYNQGKWQETETQTGRVFDSDHKRLQGRLYKSFSRKDRNELIYYHNDFRRRGPLSNETHNISDNISLKNNLAFDNERKYTFNSLISGTDQKGTDTFRKLQALETIGLSLPYHLRLHGSYSFSAIERKSQSDIQHNVNTILSHQLFASLTSSLFYEYNHTRNTAFHENRNRIGIDLQYQKNIPRGKVYFGYNYSRQNLRHESESTLIQVLGEAHNLNDGEIEMLNLPNIISSSIVVKDVTGTIIYQNFLDYILIERNTLTEIQRLPGGQIPNGGTIKVDYTAKTQGSYKYNVNMMHINAGIMLFDRLVELYYKRSQQGYDNLENTEDVTLNYLTQNIYGLKLEYRFASLGAEYDDYNSSITPYRLWRYFLQFQGNIKSRLLYSLHANYRDYHMMYNDTYQQYAEVMGNMAVVLSSTMKLNFELGYRKQIGEGIDLDLLTYRTEFVASYRKLFFKVVFEGYRRYYLGEKLNYYNAYFQLTRTFNWNKR